MQPLRRLTALVLNVLLIQVSLAGYWATCAERGEAMASPVGAAAGMAHEDGRSHQTDRTCPDRPAGEECAPPSAPAGCAALAACVAPALPAGIDVAAAIPLPSGAGWADPALTRQASRPAPDLPPPRA
jgi:hypothetical protein